MNREPVPVLSGIKPGQSEPLYFSQKSFVRASLNTRAEKLVCPKSAALRLHYKAVVGLVAVFADIQTANFFFRCDSQTDGGLQDQPGD